MISRFKKKKWRLALKTKESYLSSFTFIFLFQFTYKSFISVNSHLGYLSNRWNPEFVFLLLGIRNKIHILNLHETLFIFRNLSHLLVILTKLRKHFLFVSENSQIDYILKKVVLNSGYYIVINRWIGGIVSNYKEIYKHIFILFKPHPSKEKLKTKKDKKLEIIYDGMRFLNQIPFFVFILNAVKSKWAVNELKKFRLLLSGLIDSNTINPRLNYALPSNVKSIASQIFFIKVFTTILHNSILYEKKFFFFKKNNYKLLLNNKKKLTKLFHQLFLINKNLYIFHNFLKTNLSIRSKYQFVFKRFYIIYLFYLFKNKKNMMRRWLSGLKQ